MKRSSDGGLSPGCLERVCGLSWRASEGIRSLSKHKQNLRNSERGEEMS